MVRGPRSVFAARQRLACSAPGDLVLVPRPATVRLRIAVVVKTADINGHDPGSRAAAVSVVKLWVWKGAFRAF